MKSHKYYSRVKLKTEKPYNDCITDKPLYLKVVIPTEDGTETVTFDLRK